MVYTQVFHGHVAHWLNMIIGGLTEHWRDVTQKWPDPWYSWDGAIERGMGWLGSATGEGITVEYCIVKDPAKEPTGGHSWHGIVWPTETPLPFIPWDNEEELILANGSR